MISRGYNQAGVWYNAVNMLYPYIDTALCIGSPSSCIIIHISSNTNTISIDDTYMEDATQTAKQ